jgi:putative transport protein
MLLMLSSIEVSTSSAAQGMARLALAVTLGLALGAIRYRGIRLGISGVLFSALLFGQLGLSVNHEVLEFLRDFALIVFVYAMGLQVGPSFMASLRQEGLRLNILSLAVVALGAVFTAAIVLGVKLPREVASGLYSGAFTTTPGLAAGQEALARITAADKASTRAGLAYTVTYPFGVVGPIFVIVMLKRFFRIQMADERANLQAAEQERRPPLEAIDFKVTVPEHAGKPLRDHPLLRNKGILFSRMLRDQIMTVPTGDTLVQIGDIFRAVGSRQALNEIVLAMGEPASEMPQAVGDIERTDIVVTRTKVLRRSLADLDLIRRTGATIGRVSRAGVDLAPKATLRLQFGDRVTVVGTQRAIKLVEDELGNCPDTLNRPQLVPIFLGIALGVLVGSIPLAIPGLRTSIRIGLAGGPMLAAIALSQLGNIGSVIWYMPVAASALFRDFGLAVFLACVGLQAGDHFWQNLIGQGGAELVVWGAVVTIVPVLLVGLAARWLLKMNFITLSGWIAGAMTSTPALVFANDIAGSDSPAAVYAAVAPLGILVPIICSQLLVVLLF